VRLFCYLGSENDCKRKEEGMTMSYVNKIDLILNPSFMVFQETTETLPGGMRFLWLDYLSRVDEGAKYPLLTRLLCFEGKKIMGGVKGQNERHC
jgi:hypothetical protein